MNKILKICKENNLYLIEDCAQSHGSKYKNVNVGSFGNFACFSFYPTKTLGALGDGGAIICKTKKDSNLLKKQRNYGPGNISVGTNLESDEDVKLSLVGLWFRKNDKIQRLKQLVVLGQPDEVGENIQDTYEDLSVYGIISQIVQRKKWAK